MQQKYRNLRELMELVQARVRLRHLSPRTEEAYVRWVRRFILHHGNRDPKLLGKKEVEAFLSQLAQKRGVRPSTQNQALSAILFLYREVLEREIPWVNDVARAKRKKHLPVVMNRTETQMVLMEMKGVPGLIARVLYGSGLRLMEACRLRVKDLDFERRDKGKASRPSSWRGPGPAACGSAAPMIPGANDPSPSRWTSSVAESPVSKSRIRQRVT